MLRLAPLLSERGFDLRLASPSPSPLARAWQSLGLPHARLDLPAHGGLRRTDGSGRRPGPARLAGEAAVVSRSAWSLRCMGGEADILHSQSLNGHLETAIAGRLARRPVVLQVHDLVVPGLGRRVLTLAASASTRTVAISSAVASCVGPAARRKVVVLRHGLDLERFAPAPPDPSLRAELGGVPGAPLVGMLGRVDPEKGADLVTEAVAALSGPAAAARLVVVGDAFADPGWYERLRAEATRALGDRVRFLPPRPDVERVLQALDVLVSASVAEPFGLTILEAQACGIPVVATDAGGVPDFVHHGVTGLLVRPRDPAALASALAEVLTDEALRSRLATAARIQVERSYGSAAAADRWAELYGELVGWR